MVGRMSPRTFIATHFLRNIGEMRYTWLSLSRLREKDAGRGQRAHSS